MRLLSILAILWRICGDVARMLARRVATPLSWRWRRAATILRRVEEQ